MNRDATRLTSILGIGLTLALLAAAPAEARRGGSFGSRGMRTYSAPRYTPTAPRPVAPIQRSMTAPPAANPAAANPAYAPRPAAQAPVQQPRRGGMFGGFGGGLLGGLVAGGLLGMLLGHGWGGFGAGFANTLMQLALVALVAFVAMSFLRRRREPAPAAAAGYGRSYEQPRHDEPRYEGPAVRDFPAAAGHGQTYAQPAAPEPIEIGLTGADRDAFERLLAEVQGAFGREDYAALRERTTPEIMSYLSEELSQNAVAGRRNEVSKVRLIQADIAEAWAEGEADYATAAMRYESVDVMRDRGTGAVLEGDADRPTETTELWTFVRQGGGPWKLSAIQEA